MNDYLYSIKVDGTLYDPLRQYITDKEYVKEYIRGRVGPQFNLETYEVLRSKDSIEQFNPERIPCVVKPTHLSGQVIFLTETDSSFDRESLYRWFRTNYYDGSREPNYRYLTPKIIIEEFFSEDGKTVPNDYKFHCFNGIVKLVQVDSNRFDGHKLDYFDSDWNRIEFTWGSPNSEENPPPPENLKTMCEIASTLSQPFDYIRVDMYTNDREVKVGELTNCDGGAGDRIEPVKFERKIRQLFDGNRMLKSLG